MISKFNNKLKKIAGNNRGAAIITVIVAIAFIGMLVAMLVYMAYYNYLMKHIDKANKDNFYTAEYALDVLNAGLQKDISESMSEAYVKAMKESADIASDDEMTLNFQNTFTANLKNRISVANTEKWSKDHLTDMWTAAGLTPASYAGETGPYLDASNNTLTYSDAGYYTLNNVRIYFTNKDGYISIIETDIRLKTPDIDFAQSAGKLNLEDFSLIANKSLVNDRSSKAKPAGTSLIQGHQGTNISGSVYGGYDGMVVGEQMGIEFIKAPKDSGKTCTYNLITTEINVNNATDENAGVKICESYDTFVGDINVTSSKFEATGNTYVADDMDIAGRNSVVTLKGTYRGFGNGNRLSKDSSSILINGANTTLNFGELEDLVLSGRAYVGAKKYDAEKDRINLAEAIKKNEELADDEKKTDDKLISDVLTLTNATTDKITDEEAYADMLDSEAYKKMSQLDSASDYVPRNNSDILMGESISVKANQLMYMVPAECIGYVRNSSSSELTNPDKQIFAKNPLTWDEYDTLIHTYNKDVYEREKKKYEDANPGKTFDPDNIKDLPDDLYCYELCRLDVLWNKMGGVHYTGDECKKVFRRVNGQVMVYLFLDFSGDESMANEYFRAYYENAPESLELYFKSYVKNMTWNSRLDNKLSLGGNFVYLDSKKDLHMVNDSIENTTKSLNMDVWAEQYYESYTSLLHTLKNDYNNMTSSQQNSYIFDNLVDTSVLGQLSGQTLVDNDIKAYISKDDIVYSNAEGNSAKDSDIIISEKDVYLKSSFEGLVIAGGNIYICDDCSNVTYNPTDVVKAMQLSVEIGGKTVHVYDVFGNSGALSYGIVSGGKMQNVTLSDLITYQNWKKE